MYMVDRVMVGRCVWVKVENESRKFNCTRGSLELKPFL